MRGRILQYNGNEGTGVLVAEGQQHRFTLAAWKGDIAPVVGKTVDVVLADDEVQAITPVADDVLLREKTAELTGKLGGVMAGLGSSLSSAGASGVGGSIVARYGMVVLVSYAIFVISALAFNAITIQMFGMTQGSSLFDLSTGLSQVGGGGGVKLLLLLAFGSIAVPFVWPDKRAWLALLLPLVAVLWAFLAIQRAMSNAGPLSELFSYGFGFYLALIAALALAASGFRQFRTA